MDPAKRWITVAQQAWEVRTASCQSSGSSCPVPAVDPTRKQDMMVSCRRSASSRLALMADDPFDVTDVGVRVVGSSDWGRGGNDTTPAWSGRYGTNGKVVSTGGEPRAAVSTCCWTPTAAT